MDRVNGSANSHFPFNYFPCLKPLWKRVQSIAEYFYARFMDFYWGKPPPKESFYDVTRLDKIAKTGDFERDFIAWKKFSIEVETLVNGIFNLSAGGKSLDQDHPSGFPPVMQIGHYQKKNYIQGAALLSVVLPRRQIAYFPKPLQEQLLRFTEEQLELQFVVFRKPQGMTNFNLIFHHLFFSKYPRLGDKSKKISIGLFGGKGIKEGTERSIPWERIQKDDIIVHADGESYFHSPDNLRIQMDGKVGTFYVGAFVDHDKAYGVMGVVLDLDDLDIKNPALKIEQRIQENKTLKEFIEGCSGEVRKLFTFNEKY